MNEKLKCIMLIDDNPDDNFFHEREIKKTNKATHVLIMNNGEDALKYLESKDHTKEACPDLLFLDINMPRMTGWEFIEEYNKLDKELQSRIVIIMLSTAKNSEDVARGKKWKFVYDFIKKPLTKEIMEDIIKRYF